MFSKCVRLGVLTLVLVALGLNPAVAQASTRSAGRAAAGTAMAHASKPGILQTLWSGLGHIFEKEGSSIDPFGIPRPITGASSGTNGEGSSIAPSDASHHN